MCAIELYGHIPDALPVFGLNGSANYYNGRGAGTIGIFHPEFVFAGTFITAAVVHDPPDPVVAQRKLRSDISIGRIRCVPGELDGLVAASHGWNHTMGFGGNFASSSLKIPLDLIGFEAVRVKLRYMYASLLVCMVLLIPVNIELLLRHLIGAVQPDRSLPQPRPLDFSVSEIE